MTDTFLRNQWYVAAAASELKTAPLARLICCEPVVLFRAASGKVAALEDRCPHRKAPLSKGEVVDGDIRCGYHGVRFDAAGACTHVPSQQNIPRGFRARSYPVIEKYALVFIWMGDAEKADPALIPDDFKANSDPDYAPVFGYHHVAGHYQLMIDNLMDLTHVTFLHKSTLSGPGVMENPLHVETDGNVVKFRRRAVNVDAPVFFRKIKSFEGNIDRFQMGEFKPPIYVFLTLGYQPTGVSETLIKPSHHVINSMTPETETTCHYFWSVSRRFALDDAELSKLYYDTHVLAFDEDIAMVNAQQKMIDSDTSGTALVNFQGDKAAFESRRVVTRLLAQEAGATKVAAE